MFPQILSPNKHVLAALFRKYEKTFLASIPKQVYAVISESSKNNDPVQKHQI